MSTPYHPFDAHDADVILRAPLEQTSDQFKDFRAHKAILSVASIFFHDMFSLPQPPQPTTGDTSLPIIPVTESADVFEVFLRLIYPVEPPAITSLKLLDNLFRVAEKYMANSVHARLRQILALSPSFLRNDPIWVFALACRANLDAEAEAATRLTFKMDPVRDIPHTHLQMMTVEAYNRLLTAHATRRAQLIAAVNRAKTPSGALGACSCGSWFYTRLGSNISLAIWEKPFLDKQRLDSCLPSPIGTESKCGLGPNCGVSARTISRHFANILDEMGKVG